MRQAKGAHRGDERILIVQVSDWLPGTPRIRGPLVLSLLLRAAMASAQPSPEIDCSAEPPALRRAAIGTTLDCDEPIVTNQTWSGRW